MLRVAIAASTATIALAAPAYADDQADYSLFSSLRNNGMDITDSQLIIRQSHGICTDLSAGTPWRIVMTRLMSQNGYDLDESAALLAGATNAYCPTLKPRQPNNN